MFCVRVDLQVLWMGGGSAIHVGVHAQHLAGVRLGHAPGAALVSFDQVFRMQRGRWVRSLVIGWQMPSCNSSMVYLTGDR